MKTFVATAAIAALTTITGCAGTSQQVAQTGGLGLPSTSTVASQIPASAMPSVGTAAGMAGSVADATPAVTQMPGLVGILVQQLGITPTQALGGAGSIFSMAQQSMSPTSFGQVSNAVPGMSQILAAAPVLGGSTSGVGGLMGGAASALGTGNSLGNMAMMASSFQGLGLSSGMVSQFIPVILQYVQAQGGSATMGLLQGAIMP